MFFLSQFRAVAAQIILTTRRVNTAGSINATHTEASKAEEDFRKLQEQKKAQDLYLNKLIKDQEDLDQKALDYQAQADAMLQQSEEIMNIVSIVMISRKKLLLLIFFVKLKIFLGPKKRRGNGKSTIGKNSYHAKMDYWSYQLE